MASNSWRKKLRCCQDHGFIFYGVLPKVCSETHISCHATFSNYYLTIYPCLVLSRAMQQCMQQAGLGNRQQQQSSMAQHSLIYNPNSEERNSFENAGVVVEFPMNNFTITFYIVRQIDAAAAAMLGPRPNEMYNMMMILQPNENSSLLEEARKYMRNQASGIPIY